MLAYKVVRPDFGSYIGGPSPRLFYLPGHKVEAAHPVGLWAVTTLDEALERVQRMHRLAHVLVVELAYEASDVVAVDGSVLRLARCSVPRVVADYEPIGDLTRWPHIPGTTIDLAPLVAAIPPRPFHAHRHGVEHARRTAENAARLITGVAGADPDVLAAFALLHDAKRQSESDSEDGPRAADFARELVAGGVLPLAAGQLETLCAAFLDYPPTTTADPSVGLAWDSCRLATMGGSISSAYLSTAAAKAA